jgi:putative SOS response-associated peptidase YedK
VTGPVAGSAALHRVSARMPGFRRAVERGPEAAVRSSGMCGRYAITLPPEAVRSTFAFVERPDFPPRYNIAPTQPIPVVVADPPGRGGARHFILMRWGFLPGFVKDPRDFPLIVNARAETLGERASFRAALKRRRCLVIADGFYEWRKDAGAGGRGRAAGRPYLLRRASGEPMGFAGLYETWSESSGGGEIDTACIVTTAANRLAGLVHDRMPAILEPDAFAAWLDVDGVDAPCALALVGPAPEEALELVEIGPAVNRVAYDDASLQKPVAPPIRAGARETLF